MPTVRDRGLPTDAFTVVMATGIVSVTGRDIGHEAVAALLAVVAGVVLGVLVLRAAIGFLTTGTVVGAGQDELTRVLLSFSAVAAANVVGASTGPDGITVSAGLGAGAAALWLLLAARALLALRSRPHGSRSEGARGGWLLAAVATESLAITAAHLTRAGVLVPLLLGATLLCWALGLAVYLVIAVPVVRRVVAARYDVGVLGSDLWVLMGGLAIATLAGSSAVEASRASGEFPTVAGAMEPALVGLWVLGTAWIPALLLAELRRIRRGAWRNVRGRWATVFPVGMYSSACSALATVLAGSAAADTVGGASGILLPVLRDTGHVVFWIALVAWCIVATKIVRGSRRLGAPRSWLR